MDTVKLAPSILSADYLHLARDLADLEAAGMEYLHIDVMDGHFVPNMNFGPKLVAEVRRATAVPLDVHLMIDNPERFIEAFHEAGSDMLTIHIEVEGPVSEMLKRIRSLGMRPGIAISPNTPVETLQHHLRDVDRILVMGVRPGFGGQAFIPDTLNRVARIRTMLSQYYLDVEIGVDGGVGPANAAALIAVGTTVLVAGSSVLGRPEGTQAAMAAMRSAMQR